MGISRAARVRMGIRHEDVERYFLGARCQRRDVGWVWTGDRVRS